MKASIGSSTAAGPASLKCFGASRCVPEWLNRLSSVVFEAPPAAIDENGSVRAASVLTLANRLQRFVNKHESSINQLLRLATQEGTPKTTNSLESKNGLFKPFSPIAKFFPRVATCQVFFAGVVLMENSDVKTRGIHRGTSALQRAGINLEDLGAADFFGAVGLPKPQISLPALTG